MEWAAELMEVLSDRKHDLQEPEKMDFVLRLTDSYLRA